MNFGSPEPDQPTPTPAEASALLEHAAPPTLSTQRDRTVHAVVQLGAGLVFAGMLLALKLDLPGRALDLALTLTALAVAVAIILGLGRFQQLRTSTTPARLTRWFSVLNAVAVAVLIGGDVVLRWAFPDAPQPAATLLHALAVFLPFAAAAHRTFWGRWLPWGARGA